MTPSEQLGRVIRRLRQENGYSQEDFAAVCDVHRTYMGQIERGIGNPSLQLLVRIAKSLGISLSQLIQEAGL
ncbi:helix-turn-helix transcriptional regulator [Puniceicoccales bacterium CK1056]|uniref:Helix-turn-helix transcriptional regulator n=1 Tax=Oceanipulchritudo coccoides TaxID=2706888 RepID=A0A6B2M5F8_9BACT|nr:helix-turn-helix transcriptional regulator [Oceanipulchritudo coccoides]